MADSNAFSSGSLYLIAFAQARAPPHAGLIIPQDATTGTLVHIRIDRTTSPTWAYQTRQQKIEGEMTVTTLLRLRSVSQGAPTAEELKEVARAVPVPENDTFGECVLWIFNVITELHEKKMLCISNFEALRKEFEDFAAGNRAYARRDKFPNVAVSAYCS